MKTSIKVVTQKSLFLMKNYKKKDTGMKQTFKTFCYNIEWGGLEEV